MTIRTLRNIFLILAVTIAVYANSIPNEFVFDDLQLVVENPCIRKLNNIPAILGLTGAAPYYRPVRMASYAVDYYLYQLNPGGYHVTNILLHAITACLLLAVAGRLCRNNKAALAVALVFALHPVNTESVAYISGRRDILAALFYLLGFLIFLCYRDRRRLLFVPGIVAAYALGLGSKEMAVTLPASFFLYDFIFPHGQITGPPARRGSIIHDGLSVLKKYPLFYGAMLLSAALFVYYKVAVAPPSHGRGYYGGHVWTNALTAARIVLYYLKLLFFPIGLNADYSFNAFPVTQTAGDFAAWWACAVMVTLIVCALKVRFHAGTVAFGILWFFVTLLPVCHIVPHHEILAERYLYLPGMGIVLGVVMAVGACLQTKTGTVSTVLLCIVLALFAARTAYRNLDWRNGMSLWSKTVQTAPACARAWNNLGTEYYNGGDPAMAENAYKQALAIKPTYADPYQNLGNILVDRNSFDEAEAYFRKGYACAPEGTRIKLSLLNSWGVLYKKKGDLKDAQRIFNFALRKNPYSVQVLNNVAAIMIEQGRYGKARRRLMEALRIDPGSAEAYNNLGTVYKKRGKLSVALRALDAAVSVSPGFMEAHYNRGNILNALGRYNEALEAFQKSLSYAETPAWKALINTAVGNTYMKAGRYPAAVEALTRACKQNPAFALPHLNLASIYLYRMTDRQKALYHLKRTIELDPQVPQAEAVRNKISQLEVRQ